MFDFDKHLSDLAEQTVLCVGDLMLDDWFCAAGGR